MVFRDDLIDYIKTAIGNDILAKAIKEDELANGVQILGSNKVDLVTLGTTLNEEFLLQAVQKKSNFCIFHHGFDVRTWKSRYPTYSQKRFKLIFQNQITIIGLHYALDVHPMIGNNATIIRLLGATIREPLFNEWGYVAVFKKPQDILWLKKKCQELFHHDIFSVTDGPAKIKTIGVVSGAAKPYAEHIAEMEEKGVELFITGETSEGIPHRMKESGINYFACGHYNTEVFGIKELGEKIIKKYGNQLKVEFIDIPNRI